MAERTAEEVARIFTAAGDSVTLINRDTAKEDNETEQDWKDRIKRNTDHLELIKEYKKEDGTTSIWTTEDFTDIDAAIVSGKALIAQCWPNMSNVDYQIIVLRQCIIFMADRIALAQEKESLSTQVKEIVDNYNKQVEELLGDLPATTQASIDPLNKRIQEINAILLNDIDKEAGVANA